MSTEALATNRAGESPRWPVYDSFGDEGVAARILENAKALRPMLEEYAPSNEQNGVIAEEVIKALEEKDILRMAAPRRWGGLALSAQAMAAIVAELAKGCPSTSWVVSILNSVLWVASTTSPEMQAVLFANGVPRLCSPQNGKGTITRRGDKYVVNGRWGYGTAVRHADWVLVVPQLEDGAMAMAAVPIKDVRLENAWDVAGMQSTASDTVSIEDVEISADQVSTMDPGTVASIGRRVLQVNDQGEPADYWGSISLLRSKALGVLVGAAEALLDCAIATKDKPMVLTVAERRSDSAVWLAGLGRAGGNLRAARAIMERETALIDRAALERRSLTYEERAELRGECAVQVDLMIHAVEQLMTLIGSSGFANANKAQRYWRDFSIGVRHVIFSSDTGYEVYGASLVGKASDLVAENVV